MRAINLIYEDKDFEKLKKIKEKTEEKTKQRVKWEDFVFNPVCGK